LTATASVRIVIAGEHPIFRDGLRRLLEVEEGFVIEKEVGVGPATATLVQESRPERCPRRKKGPASARGT
jgi:DNA-binding NarL/FixJ family response regulator